MLELNTEHDRMLSLTCCKRMIDLQQVRRCMLSCFVLSVSFMTDF
jgi:hypothetical protein